MRIALVTLFPEMFDAILDYGITGRAVDSQIIEVATFNPRNYTEDRHQTVDDRPYGGGPGMVMMVEPLRKAIAEARSWAGDGVKVIYLSPRGKVLNQHAVAQFACDEALVLIAGRYEGIDERLIALEVDEEWSIGDYVLSGGELAAMVLMDALIRLLPGALGHQQSAQQDSFSDGLLDCPHYTRPLYYDGIKVPDVLLSGNHEQIRRWRLQQSLLKTRERRPDLLQGRQLTKEEAALLEGTSQESVDEGKK